MTRSILFLSPVRFDGLRQRHQGLACELARVGYQVEFIDPIESSGYSLHASMLEGPEGTGHHLRCWKIRLPCRAARSPILQKFMVSLAWRLLKRPPISLSAEAIIWVGDPSWSGLPRPKRGFMVYDRCDRHGAFPGQDGSPWGIHEKNLYKKSDLVLATTLLLKDEAEREGAREVLLVPNALATDWQISGERRSRIHVVQDRPLRLLSAGAHYEWVDCDWLASFADRPEFELHLAGPGRGVGWERLSRHPRARVHGILSHERLRDLQRTMDIGLVAFIPSPLTETVDPVKVYEYAACRLQVWGTPVEALRAHPLVDAVIADPRTLDEKSLTALFSAPRQTRLIPTWNHRLATILKHLPSPA